MTAGRLFAMLIALVLAAGPLRAESVVAGLSQEAISITTDFDGSEILIYGAVRRDAPPPGTGPMQVVITVEGPDRSVTVRRKDRRFGIWINTDASEIDAAPTFYAVQSSAPMAEALSHTEDLRHRVTIPMAIRAVGTGLLDQDRFTEALIRLNLEDDAYQLNEGAVRFREEVLFDTSVRLPANLTEGDYRARIFLTRGGEVVDVYEQTIPVRKVGLERLIYRLAHENPLIYGILSLLIAVGAGWMASAAFRYMRG
ncbi:MULTISPECIES: TIGR02186 family protein [Roseicyclus]|uniref:Membrane protein n=1 Tax=Roseicyclus marinus TaxID=2161673 RepID=A0AA48H2W9_9RHOB|nr:membrane protein [Roseicyclus marinus]